MNANCVPLRWKLFLGPGSVYRGHVSLIYEGNGMGMKNSFRLASYMFCSQSPRDLGVWTRSRESGKQSSGFRLVFGCGVGRGWYYLLTQIPTRFPLRT